MKVDDLIEKLPNSFTVTFTADKNKVLEMDEDDLFIFYEEFFDESEIRSMIESGEFLILSVTNQKHSIDVYISEEDNCYGVVHRKASYPYGIKCEKWYYNFSDALREVVILAHIFERTNLRWVDDNTRREIIIDLLKSGVIQE